MSMIPACTDPPRLFKERFFGGLFMTGEWLGYNLENFLLE